MDEKQKQIVELKTKISNLEYELQAAKRALFELDDTDTAGTVAAGDNHVIEGTFNGENMESEDGKIFPVPANYASKSKLVEGDRLKLTIGDDGAFLFKQIGPAERKKAIGALKFENNAYFVEVDGANYHVLYASVTYYKAKPGDKVSIVLPGSVQAPKWCTLEGVIHDISVADRTAAEEIMEQKITEEMKQPITDNLAAPVSIAQAETDGIDRAKSSLSIDELEIVGAKDQATPEAVNPAELTIPTTIRPQEPSSTTIDTRADAIQELEI